MNKNQIKKLLNEFDKTSIQLNIDIDYNTMKLRTIQIQLAILKKRNKALISREKRIKSIDLQFELLIEKEKRLLKND